MVKSKIGYGTIALMLVVALLTSLIGVVGTSGTAYAMPKSVYLIASINADPCPINAYNIGVGPNLTYQGTFNVTSHVNGGVGLAMYEDPNGDGDFSDARIFVTYEDSDITEVFNAWDFSYVGNYTCAGASDLAGIVCDQEKERIYTIDRRSTRLYVYDANTLASLAPPPGYYSINGTSGSCWDLALDERNDHLFVADADSTVQYYDTATFSLQGTITTNSWYAVGIAVDDAMPGPNTVVYTGGAFQGDYRLAKYDMNAGTGTYIYVPTVTGISSEGIMGLAVDIDTHHVYATTGYSGDNLRVFDSNLNHVLLYPDNEGKIIRPAGIVIPREEIAYNPLNLTKDDGVATCVDPGDTITYTICYDNTGNTFNVTGVNITDNLWPGLIFVSATGGGSYNGGTHSVTWDIGNMTAGDPGGCVTLTVHVPNPTTGPGTNMDNVCSIISDQTPITTVHEYTQVCMMNGVYPVVGGEVYPVDKLAILAPWIALAAIIIPGVTIAVRRRRARS